MTDTWGRRLFKSGGVWLVLTGLVHSLSFLRKPVAANDTERQLLDLMTNYHFSMLGSVRSMSTLMRGFSVAFMLGAFVVGAIALALANEHAGLLKRVALIITLWLVAMTAVSLNYFFVVPTTFLGIGLLLFLLAWIKFPAEGVS